MAISPECHICWLMIRVIKKLSQGLYTGLLATEENPWNNSARDCLMKAVWPSSLQIRSLTSKWYQWDCTACQGGRWKKKGNDGEGYFLLEIEWCVISLYPNILWKLQQYSDVKNLEKFCSVTFFCVRDLYMLKKIIVSRIWFLALYPMI